MNYFVSSEYSLHYNGQSPRSPLAKTTSYQNFYANPNPNTASNQDSTAYLSYYPSFKSQDDYFISPFTPMSHPSTDCSVYCDLQSFDAMPSPSPFSTFSSRIQLPANPTTTFQVDSNPPSLTSLPEFPPVDFFKESSTIFKDKFQNYSTEEFDNSCLKQNNHPLVFTTEEEEEEGTDSCSEQTAALERTESSESFNKSILGRPDLKGWCEEDEILLRKLAVQYKYDWKKVAKKFSNKKYTPHFLKMRFKGYDEGPVPKRVKFTHEEDILIAKYFDEYGVDWERMVAHFPNRTAMMIKNRYYSFIRKKNKYDHLLQEAKSLDGSNQQETPFFCEGQSETPESLEGSEEFTNELGTDSLLQNDISVDGSDENALLRAKLKSLRNLYLVTYKELCLLKKGYNSI